MAIQSLDQLLASLSAGKSTDQNIWNKITGGTAYTAGRWYDFSQLAGTPVANAFAGTALAWRGCDETTGNGTQIFGLPHGGNVSGDIKHILNAMAVSAVASAVPGVLSLVDMQGYYPGITNNLSTAQILTGAPTLRYANGAGCRAYFVQTAVTGATAQNISLSYTNQAAVAGRALPVTVSMTASAIAAHISHSGTAANNYGPFLPLASGDTGIQSIQSVTFSAANTGTGALVIARPLFNLPITTAAVASERDFLNQLPSLPVIRDGACLAWMYFAGSATGAATNFYGGYQAVWG